MPKADIVVEITYNVNEPEKTVIRTNAKPDKVSEIFETWLVAQIGKGKDSREPVRKNEYKITIKLDLSDDTFYVSSDTGNNDLTVGIFVNLIGIIQVGHSDKIQISTL